MASLNRVFLMGNLTRDPELRYIPSGTAVASFGLAINTVYSTPTGEKKEDVCFVRVVVWGKQGENCAQYLAKGRPVFVEGRLIYRSWEKDGQTRTTLEVRADRVQFLGAGRGRGPGEPSEAEAPVAQESSPADEPSAKPVAVEAAASDEEPPF